MSETHWGKNRTVPIISMDTGYICNAIQWHYKKKVYPKLVDYAGKRLEHDEVITWLNKYPTYNGPSLRRTWRGLIVELEKRVGIIEGISKMPATHWYDERTTEHIDIFILNPAQVMYALGSKWSKNQRVHQMDDPEWFSLWGRRYELKISSDFFERDNHVLNKLRQATHEFSNSLPSNDEYGYGAWKYE